MKKFNKESKRFTVVGSVKINNDYTLLKVSLSDGGELLECLPGQFVQVKIDNSPSTFLRRPISICFVEEDQGILWLLVRRAGEGTSRLCDLKKDDELDLIYPLGKGFTVPGKDKRVLLVGGGVGVAPLLYLGYKLKNSGVNTEFLLGGRSEEHLMLTDEFARYGNVNLCTDDGSMGYKGLVTEHPVFGEDFDRVYCCGPLPMMKAVARCVKGSETDCEVSLENLMACGLGACLCCVEKTVKGNACVCTEGPVFNIKELTW